MKYVSYPERQLPINCPVHALSLIGRLASGLLRYGRWSKGIEVVIKSPLRGHPFYGLYDSSAYKYLRGSYDSSCQLNGSGWLCYNMNPV